MKKNVNISQKDIRCAWESFVSDGVLPHGCVLPAQVVRAWDISRSYGISAVTPQPPPVLGKKELARLQRRHGTLMAAAEPVLGMLEVSIRSTGYIATLAIAEGYLLSVVGDTSLMAEAHRVYNVPGALRSVEAVGASALSLCIAERRPLQVTGSEHYNRMFHDWKCAAAPIFDSENRAMASLTISGHISRKDHHTLALAKSCADVITIRLREHGLLQTGMRLNSMLQSVYDALPEAVLAIREDGVITHANNNARALLASEGESLEGCRAADVFTPAHLPTVHELLRVGKPRTCEVEVYCAEGPQPRTCRFAPIRLKNGGKGGMTVSINSRGQIIDLARHAGGNYARYTFRDIKGRSAALRVQMDLAERAARTNSRVLLTGESGTGKELFAQSIHNAGPAAAGPFVAISCAAIPRDLIEAELFGYVGGAFTGAREKGMIGKIELASGGTLFLDEVNSLPLDMQAKLLRALQQKEIVRIGDVRPTAVDVRVVAATNVNLMEAVRQGAFREDLYYRLNVVEIIIPPLRARRDDIRLLASLFLRRICASAGLAFVEPAPEVYEMLEAYPWPGNVRELDNVCERTLLVAGGDRPETRHLPPHIREACTGTEDAAELPAGLSLPATGNMDEIMKELIAAALQRSRGNVSKAAASLGLARSTLYRNIRRFDLTWERLGREGM